MDVKHYMERIAEAPNVDALEAIYDEAWGDASVDTLGDLKALSDARRQRRIELVYGKSAVEESDALEAFLISAAMDCVEGSDNA